jgi:hypothetical protein
MMSGYGDMVPSVLSYLLPCLPLLWFLLGALGLYSACDWLRFCLCPQESGR